MEHFSSYVIPLYATILLVILTKNWTREIIKSRHDMPISTLFITLLAFSAWIGILILGNTSIIWVLLASFAGCSITFWFLWEYLPEDSLFEKIFFIVLLATPTPALGCIFAIFYASGMGQLGTWFVAIAVVCIASEQIIKRIAREFPRTAIIEY